MVSEATVELPKRIGWIGLGAMGGAMARNALRAGFRLTVYDTRPEAIAALLALGADAARNAAQVAEGGKNKDKCA